MQRKHLPRVWMGIAIKTCIAIYCNTDGRIMILIPIYWDRVKEFTLNGQINATLEAN